MGAVRKRRAGGMEHVERGDAVHPVRRGPQDELVESHSAWRAPLRATRPDLWTAGKVVAPGYGDHLLRAGACKGFGQGEAVRAPEPIETQDLSEDLSLRTHPGLRQPPPEGGRIPWSMQSDADIAIGPYDGVEERTEAGAETESVIWKPP